MHPYMYVHEPLMLHALVQLTLLPTLLSILRVRTLRHLRVAHLRIMVML